MCLPTLRLDEGMILSLGRASKTYHDGLIHQMPYEQLNDRARWAKIQSGLWIPSETEMARLVDLNAKQRDEALEADARRYERRARIRARWFGDTEEQVK